MSFRGRIKEILRKNYRCSHHDASRDLNDEEALEAILQAAKEELIPVKKGEIDIADEDRFWNGFNATIQEMKERVEKV